ncbi:hypothetical protein [Sphingopyxis fribergensis]
MNRREFAGLTAATLLSGSGAARAAPPGTPSRASEVSALRQFAEITHPRGRDAKQDRDWQQRWSALESKADGLSDGAYFIATRRALGWFADGHTTVLPFGSRGAVPPGAFGLALSYRVRVFDDGAYVVAASETLAPIGGKRVDRIGALSTAALIRAAAQDWPGNRAWAQRWAGAAFSSPALLQGLDAVRDPGAVSLGLAGTSALQAIAPLRAPQPEPIDMPRPLSWSERSARDAGRGNFVLPVPEHRAIYVSIDDMADVDGKSFEALTRDCIAAMAAPGHDRLVIDLRRNGGGNNFLGEPIRRTIAASRFNRTGNLYVLVGPRTFSAAQNLANRLERETMALFVGTPTGGEPNHYGDAASFTGEATGLAAMVSAKAWFDSYPMDNRPWIMPDLIVPELFSDWQAGKDPALDLALRHRPDRIVSELDMDRVFYFGRASQSAKWNPFWVAGDD